MLYPLLASCTGLRAVSLADRWDAIRRKSKRIVGPMGEREPSRDLNIVWVWGIDKLHEKETHEYAWVMDRYVNVLLPQVPRVTVVPPMWFPKKEQWEKADLVVFYMWPRGRDGITI